MAMRENLNLEINVEESWVHVPAWAWAGADRAPAAYAEALAAFPALANLPLRLAGCKVLGFPIGTTEFCQEFVVAKVCRGCEGRGGCKGRFEGELLEEGVMEED
eukprot:1414618-Rhodomonas_salina.2